MEALNTYDPPTTSARKVGQEHVPEQDTAMINIRKAQESLRDRGFAPGSIDGNLGAETRAAISKFQASENLTITGQLDMQTAARLGVQPELQ
jgi:peptidoglycan hydrolase-like protein with peptidoglycan-binding domain